MNKLKHEVLSFSFILFILTGFLNSCEKKAINPAEKEPQQLNSKLNFEEKEYNEKVNTFAKIVSSSLENNDFREELKHEALKMIDGDYDVIVSHITRKSIKSQNENKIDFTVKKLFKSHFLELSNSKVSFEAYYENLLELYPYLQIAIPSNCEKWDSKNYKPIVGFIPAEFDEKTTETITGYLPNGERIAIDTKNEPDKPVIIIGLNERVERVKASKSKPIPDDPQPTPTPGTLSAETSGSYIVLSWSRSPQASALNTFGYKIYRKGPNENSFTVLSINSGMNNVTYFDNNFSSNDQGQPFSYYVKAYHLEAGEHIYSGATNIATENAPFAPNALESFDAIQQTYDDIELRWTNGQNVFDHTEIYKRVIHVHGDYQLIGEFDHNTHYYIDNEMYHGKKVIYRAYQVSSNGFESDHKYDFVRVPYRDISTECDVYIDMIEIGRLNDIESWIQGAPEIEVSIGLVSTNDEHSVIVTKPKMDFWFDTRSDFQTYDYNYKIIDDWTPDSWYEGINFKVSEFDRSWGTLTLDFNLGYKAKNTEKTGLVAGGNVGYKIVFKKSDEQCGTAEYYYYEEKNEWVDAFDYGVKLHISDTPAK
ncbi:MAG: hypothetical protein U9N85_08375 [Bacteroidota bacterium]|nr:hypothetical protein [Bacteroidota bacterium]